MTTLTPGYEHEGITDRCVSVPYGTALQAQNDPFLPAGALPMCDEASKSVTLEFPNSGGHVGFVSDEFPGKLDWLPERITNFFAVT